METNKEKVIEDEKLKEVAGGNGLGKYVIKNLSISMDGDNSLYWKGEYGTVTARTSTGLQVGDRIYLWNADPQGGVQDVTVTDVAPTVTVNGREFDIAVHVPVLVMSYYYIMKSNVTVLNR